METTKAIWRERIARWEESKLTAEEFAPQEGVKPSSLKWWRWRLGGETRRSRRSAERSPFVEVKEARPRAASTVWHFEIALWNGRVVRVRPGFTDEELARVLAVAERPHR
jgi:hypothetical protein